MKHSKLLARAGLLAGALALLALTWVWELPPRYDEGPKALFSAAARENTGTKPGEAPEEQGENGGEKQENAPLTLTYFADLSQPYYARLGQLLEESATEEKREIITFDTKNKELIYKNQVKIACSDKKAGVALLCGAGEAVADYAASLTESGYSVIVLNSDTTGVKKGEIRGEIRQNWSETARLVQEYLEENMDAEGRYFLFPDQPDAALESAFYATLEFERYYTVYTTNNVDLTRSYALYAYQTRSDMGALICQSSASALAAAEAAEEAESLAMQGDGETEPFTRDGVKLGVLALDDGALALLREGRLDFAVGVTVEETYGALQTLLGELGAEKRDLTLEISPRLVTAETAETLKLGY